MEILLLERLIPEAQAWLEARHRVAFRPELAADPAALRKALYNVQALVLPRKLPVTGEFLGFAPVLRAVARLHVGSDNTDLEACREHRVRLIQPINANVRSNAEYLLASLLLLYRRGIGASLNGERHAAPTTGRELTPHEGSQPPAATPGQSLAPERFSAGERAHVVGLTEERSAEVVRQSGNARKVAFLATLVIALFIPLYWFYEIGVPALGVQGRMESNAEEQFVTDVQKGGRGHFQGVKLTPGKWRLTAQGQGRGELLLRSKGGADMRLPFDSGAVTEVNGSELEVGFYARHEVIELRGVRFEKLGN